MKKTQAATPRNALDQPATNTPAQTAGRLLEKALHNQGTANRKRIRDQIEKTLSS
jgi:hypothetical protein